MIDTVDTNLIGLMLITKLAIPAISPQGHIINIGSMAAVRPFVGGSVYAAAKAGVLAFSEGLALELQPLIKVTCFMPGATDTIIGRQFGDTETMLEPSDIAGAVISALRMGDKALLGRMELRPFMREKLL